MKRSVRSLFLVLLFLALGSVPLFFAVKRILGSEHEFVASAADKLKMVVPATREGRYIEIAHNPELNAHAGKDFLFMFWFKLKRLPDPGERLILASKYAGSPPNVVGYAVGIRNDEDVLRPIVFWGPDRGRGRWYDFPEIAMRPDEWNMFALSFHKDKFLGLKRVQQLSGQTGPIEALGGYELKDGTGDFSDAALELGSTPGRGFKGFIGPLAIVAKRNLSDDFKAIIKDFKDSPLAMPGTAAEKNVRLFVLPDLVDHSRFNNKVSKHGTW